MRQAVVGLLLTAMLACPAVCLVDCADAEHAATCPSGHEPTHKTHACFCKAATERPTSGVGQIVTIYYPVPNIADKPQDGPGVTILPAPSPESVLATAPSAGASLPLLI